MNKQTAVQWLIDRLMDGQVDNKMLITALHLEKEQLEKAFYDGDCNGTFETINKEQYYKENYENI